ncbi:MAG: F0F1 ATP synthase subunit delta [Betaproteobacteria bacterium]|jgi:F-type H+-transporting ATPase subunit delta|nr:F0F1 ATP synthase subunit delta [Betaproteobacteria bacterium]NBP44425.1 F0F1 ATP synthase subunit delta [Betaproteobacteria bacterium]
MAELATIARPYAEALFQSAKGQASADADWLNELALVAEQPQLQQFADNPKVTPDQVFGLFTSVIKSKLSDRATNFLHTLISNNRLVALPEIARQFHALVNAQQGLSDAHIQSAFPLEGADLAQVQAVLEKRFGRKLNVSVDIQPELIGGIRVVVGDEVLDTSVKARLEQMKVALTA